MHNGVMPDMKISAVALFASAVCAVGVFQLIADTSVPTGVLQVHSKVESAANTSKSTCGIPAVKPFLLQTKGRPPCVVNADNDHYFKRCCMANFVPVEERVSSPDGAKRYIDAISESGRITHLFACAIGQRADYDSKVCDPIWMAIDEAAERGVEPDNAKRMHDVGFDCFKVWCEIRLP